MLLVRTLLVLGLYLFLTPCIFSCLSTSVVIGAVCGISLW